MTDLKNNITIFSLGVLFISIAIVAPWFNIYVSNHDLVKSFTAYIGSSIFMFALIYDKCLRPDISIKVNYLKITLFLLFAFGALSTLWSVNFDFTINKLLLWSIALFSFVLSLNLHLTHENLIKIAWILIFTASTIAIIGLLQRFFSPFSLTEAAWPASTFGNKNMAAQVIVLIFPLFAFLLVSNKVQSIKAWILLANLSIVLSYVLFTESRAVWLSITIELFLVFAYFIINKSTNNQWVSWDRSKTYASIAAVSLTVLILHLSPHGDGEFQNAFADVSQRVISTGTNIDSSSDQRFQIWDTALKMIESSPFIGTGLGSFAHNIANGGFATWTINNTMRAHNDLLELIVELGYIGLLIFCSVILAILFGVSTILKNTSDEIHFFFLVILISLIGSFVNLQFSFPYQMAIPILIFGFYTGLIAKYLDKVSNPLFHLRFSIPSTYKKIILFVGAFFFSVIFYLTYFNWINAFEKLDDMRAIEDYSQLEIVETPIFNQKMQFMLYSLGGNYFNLGNYSNSKIFDNKFLEVWPNHLDVLYRASYAEHRMGNNSDALKMTKKLKKIEPDGLFNSYIVEMFIYLDKGNIEKLEKTFMELNKKSDEFLKLNDDTYRLMLFFTLASKKLNEYAPILYEKFINEHGYSCEVENNIAIHYFNLENYYQASMHVKKTTGRDQKCLNPDLIRILNEMGFLA